MAIVQDLITKRPDLHGKHGKAWLINLDKFCRLLGFDPDDRPQVAIWIVEAEWAHPIWHSYFLALLHLRDSAKTLPHEKAFPEATHQIYLSPLNYSAPRLPVIQGRAVPALLEPPNFNGQFVAQNDAHAMQQVELAIRDVCQAKLSPDSDARLAWVARFSQHSTSTEAS